MGQISAFGSLLRVSRQATTLLILVDVQFVLLRLGYLGIGGGGGGQVWSAGTNVGHSLQVPLIRFK